MVPALPSDCPTAICVLSAAINRHIKLSARLREANRLTISILISRAKGFTSRSMERCQQLPASIYRQWDTYFANGLKFAVNGLL